MLKWDFKNKRGQASAVEQAILFAVVAAVIAGMTTYVKRAMQARIRGARNYMYAQVNQVYRSPLYHPNTVLPSGYEPYYAHTTTDKVENVRTSEFDQPWAGHEGKFESGINSVVSSVTVSNVLSASHSD